MHHIDLNADIGEGFPYDAELLRYITSCNIACGGHIGDERSMVKTIHLAKKHEVKIGAHPSYPDKLNFGRKSLNISIDELISSIDKQLKSFQKCINNIKANWNHIKFHGALYNDLKDDKDKAKAIVKYLSDNHPNKILFVPPRSELKNMASSCLSIMVEGFADRAYNEDLSLVPRSLNGAVLTEFEQVRTQVVDIALNQKVKSINGKYVKFKADTLCLHGDTPSALDLAKKIVSYLSEYQIRIQ